MPWSFVILFLLVQLVLVNSVEVHEDVTKDTTVVDDSDELNSTEIVSNNVQVVANWTKGRYSDEGDLKNISKTIDESEIFQKEASGKVLRKEDDLQENSTVPAKFKNSSSAEIKQQTVSQSPNLQNITETFVPARGGGSIKPVKRYSTEISYQASSPSRNHQSTKKHYLSALIGGGVKVPVREKGFSTEIRTKAFSQSTNSQRTKENFVPVVTTVGNDFSHPNFIPSPEIKVNDFGSTVLFDQDSFQPVLYPFLQNEKELPIPTRRMSVEYQEKPKQKGTKGGANYLKNAQIFQGDVIKVVQPKRHTNQVKRRNEQGNWVILDNSEEVPQNKIINFDHQENFYDQDDYRAPAVIPVHEEIRGDHPYPFEYVRDDDSSNWLHSTSPPLEGAEYEDHSYEVPPPSPSRPHSLPDTPPHPDWESKFTRGKEIVKPSPLHGILHVLGAIVPIGLLLSALTPNVVMINPNATSTFKQTPGALNLFRGRHRSLKEHETSGKSNFDNIIRKLAEVRVQQPLTESNCNKKQLCEYLALHGAALADLQKTIENILDRSHALTSEVNVSMDELVTAARRDSCSSVFVCKETVETAAGD